MAYEKLQGRRAINVIPDDTVDINAVVLVGYTLGGS